MPDLREQIMARLLEVAASVPGVQTAARNRGGISEGGRPAIVVLDADEAVDDEFIDPGRPARGPQIVMMTPEVFVLVGRRAADIGAELNAFRRRIIRRVLTDAPLIDLVGPNGSIRYLGCGTQLAVGRTMEGEMAVSFAFRYALRPTDLED